MVHVTDVSLQDFKGVEGPISLTLAAPCTAQGRMQATILFGENGWGKSTFCDALEFALRGQLSRRHVGGEKVRREIRNLLGGRAPRVTCSLSDGDEILRGRAQGRRESRVGAVQGFQLAPIIIRRNAVENFWSVPESVRLEFFWDYFTDNTEGWRTAQDEQAIADHDALLRRLDVAGGPVEGLLSGVSVLDSHGRTQPFQRPTHINGLNALKGALQRGGHQRGQGGLTPEASRAFEEYRSALEAEVGLRSRAQAARARSELPAERIAETVRLAAPNLTQDFLKLADLPWLAEVRLLPEIDDRSRGLKVLLVDGRGNSIPPVSVLSEAYLDLLALLLLIEVHLACAELGQAKILILDDVFQSVDAPLRQNCLRVILGRLQGWQLLFTMHDRLWLEFASATFKQEGWAEPSVVEIQRFPGSSSLVLKGGLVGPMRDVDYAMKGSAVLAAGAVGRAAEALLDRLTIEWQTKMPRMPFYMIQQLTDALTSTMDNCDNQEVRQEFRNLKRVQFIRNSVGAHSSAYADSVSMSDVQDAARAVRRLWELLFCHECGRVAVREPVSNGKWVARLNCCTTSPS